MQGFGYGYTDLQLHFADSHVSSDLEYKATASLELPTGIGSTIRNLVNADATNIGKPWGHKFDFR